MSDQQPPAEPDTAAVAGPTEAPGTAQNEPPYGDPSTPAEKRYSDLRSWTDRVAQENSELRPYKDQVTELQQKAQWYELLVTSDDPDTRRQAAEVLGFDLPDDEDVDEGFEPDGYEDPTEQLVQRLEALEGRIDSQAQAERQQVEQEFTSAYAHDQLDELGVDPEDMEFRQVVFERALSLPRVRPLPGMPVESLVDVKAAYEQIKAYEDSRMKRWASTKRAPYVPPGGQSANEVPDPGTGHNARMNRAMQFLHNNQGDE